MSHVPAFTGAAAGATHMPAFENAGGVGGNSRYWARMYPGRYWARMYPGGSGSGGAVSPHMPAFVNA